MVGTLNSIPKQKFCFSDISTFLPLFQGILKQVQDDDVGRDSPLSRPYPRSAGDDGRRGWHQSKSSPAITSELLEKLLNLRVLRP